MEKNPQKLTLNQETLRTLSAKDKTTKFNPSCPPVCATGVTCSECAPLDTSLC